MLTIYTYDIILKMRRFVIYYIWNLFLLESYELAILEITVCLQSRKIKSIYLDGIKLSTTKKEKKKRKRFIRND